VTAKDVGGKDIEPLSWTFIIAGAAAQQGKAATKPTVVKPSATQQPAEETKDRSNTKADSLFQLTR